MHKKQERIYSPIALFSLSCGTAACVMIVFGLWNVVFLFYLMATASRLLAGAIMNRESDVALVKNWNDRCHRFVVIILNSVVGFVLMTRLAWDAFRHTHIGPCVFLVIVFVAYFIVARFTNPNTFGARARSATLTVTLLSVMAYLAWNQHWGLWALAGVIALNFVWLRLRALQRRFGWADR